MMRVLPVAGLIALGTSLSADIVSLRGSDGTLNITGELIGFNGDYYTVQTDLGDLRISTELVTCDGAGCPALETVESDVTMGGADAVAEGLMPLLLAGYATNIGAEARGLGQIADGQTGTTLTAQDGFGEVLGTVAVQSDTSDDAFAGLQDGRYAVGLSSRRITPDEARGLTASGAGNMIDPAQEHIVAIDSLVVIVHPNNPINALSAADLADIYAGKINDWSEVGGPNAPIAVVSLGNDDTTPVFRQGIFGDNDSRQIQADYQARDNVDAAVYVSDNPNAIAYVGFAFKRGQKPLNIISECGIGTTPDAFSVKTEEYALFRRLYLYNRADLDDALAADFLTFATSPDASNVILQAGFIDLSIEEVPLGASSPRAQRASGSGVDDFENAIIDDMIAQMASHQRLSSTFRFRTGSTQLDPRGLADVDRLIDHLKDAPSGTNVMLVGFADNVGAFEPNITLSEGRAAQVRSEILNRSNGGLEHITFTTKGYGEISPAACNTSDSGRAINRRVEAWIATP